MQERNEMAFTLGMILEARKRLKGVAQRTGLVQFKRFPTSTARFT
ncbi:MAG: hypothetical protein ACLVB5_02970 [Christensenellales bacterium]